MEHVDTQLLSRPLTEEEQNVISKCVGAYNNEQSSDLFKLVLGSNMRVEGGRLKGYAAVFPMNAKVRLDLLKTGEYGTARVVHRVSNKTLDGRDVNQVMFQTPEAKEALTAAVVQSVHDDDVSMTFGAHAVDPSGMFVDKDSVPTMGDNGTVGVAMYTKKMVANNNYYLLVSTVSPQALALQADAHIDEAVRQGHTFAQMFANTAKSELADAMGTSPHDLFAISNNNSGYGMSSQYVSSRCGTRMAQRVADALGLQFEEADMKDDVLASSSFGHQIAPEAMTESFTNLFVPMGDYVVFYCDMVNTQQSPVIAVADHALAGWRLARGPEMNKISHGKPKLFKALPFGNPDLACAYPFSAPVYCKKDQVPETELSLDTLDIAEWRGPASSILAFDGPTLAFSPSFNVGLGLRGDSLELAVMAHQEDTARVDALTRSQNGNYVGSNLELTTCVMRVATINELDRGLYDGDCLSNKGEIAAANARASSSS